MTFQKTVNEMQAFHSGAINEYDILTPAEMRRIENLNARNGYGVSSETLVRMVRQHEKSRAKFDIKTMAKIEYRLTDINFHTECGLLHKGDYDAALKMAKEW